MDLFHKCHAFTRARELQAAGAYPYFIPIANSQGTEVEIDGHRLIMIGSNNYLGLTHDPRVQRAAQLAIQEHGTACTGSRFLNGTLELHEELERRLARFLGREAALCFSTGYQANLGVISALCGKGDVILCDRENHASIIDGCRLTFAETRKFRHNDPEHLESLLKKAVEEQRGILIIVDGAFSMMGDLADLPTITALARTYGARLLVDEAHSVGVLGKTGRGVVEHFGLDNEVDLVVGTFSKSFASIGGFLAGPDDVVHYVKHHARSLIFSASIPPSAAATALAALDVMESEPERRRRLLQHARRVARELSEMGYTVGPTETPIVPVVIGDQDRLFRFWKALFQAGVYANPVTSPGVPPRMDLVRTSYMATHTDEQIQRILAIFSTVGTRLGVISASRAHTASYRYGQALG